MTTTTENTIAQPTDLLSITHGIIAHQVNLQGAMGAGLAKNIDRLHPVVKDK